MKFDRKRLRDALSNIGVALVIASVVQVLFSDVSPFLSITGAAIGTVLVLASAIEEDDQ